jgi:hypothetical protein
LKTSMDEANYIDDKDPYFTEENDSAENEEDLNEVLLREIEEEETREKAMWEAAIKESKARGEPPVTGSQLTDFQEQIITTGSGVGKALLIMLIIAFFLKIMEIILNYMKRKAALLRVKSAISSTRRRSIDEYDPKNPNFKRTEYVEYNAELKTAVIMEEKIRQGSIDKRSLLKMLHKRMYEFLRRRVMLQKNELAVTNAYQMYILPMEVWDDFQAAKESLYLEMVRVKIWAEKFGVCLRSLLESAQAKLLADDMRKSMSKCLQPKKQGKEGKKSIRSSRSGSRSQSPMTPAGRLEAKRIRRRRKFH